jgi:hypothetical protein
MPVIVAQDSPDAKEMVKWEQFPSVYGPVPGNPYVYRPFPKATYRAYKDDAGKTRLEQRDAKNAAEFEMLTGQGYVNGAPVAARGNGTGAARGQSGVPRTADESAGAGGSRGGGGRDGRAFAGDPGTAHQTRPRTAAESDGVALWRSFD